MCDSQVLFDAVVPVTVHVTDREDRHASLTVYISVSGRDRDRTSRRVVQITGIAVMRSDRQQVEWTDNHQQRTLHVRLTEEADPFFLYQLTISEEDFQGDDPPSRHTPRRLSVLDPDPSSLQHCGQSSRCS